MASGHDVVVVGGGAVGSAVAYFLCREGVRRVAVIERDPVYARASSTLSAGSIRQQFSTPVNIALSRFGAEFLRAADEHLSVDGVPTGLHLHEPGYLYLATPAGLPVLRANHAVQRECGVAVALLDPDALRARFPWLDTAGLAAGSLGLQGEGWFDGHALLQAFRRKARDLGARYVHGEVVGFERDGARIAAVRLADGSRLPCDTAVNAAGPYARRVAEMAGLDLPVEARCRSVFVFRAKRALPGCPLVIEPGGVWFRPEGDGFICGLSPPAERDPECFELGVDHALFEDAIWPALAARVPLFEELRPTGSWAGHYEYNTFDQNALLGAMPEVPNLVFANGFSGHGLQHAPGVGRGVAELIAHGAYRGLDLSALSVTRLARGRPVVERCVI